MKLLQSDGYFLNYKTFSSDTNYPSLKHYFCGQHHSLGAECPNCKRNLLRFMQIDLTDDRIDLKQENFNKLQLFFCWTCNVSQAPFFYRVISNEEIKILKFKKGGVDFSFPYDDYPEYFPGSVVTLEKISEQDTESIALLNSRKVKLSKAISDFPWLCRPRHQIGGEPYFLHSDQHPLKCPSCKMDMELIASVGNDCNDIRGLTGNEFVQVLFFYCRNCIIVGASQQSD